jgi:hypothetical protein
MNKIHQMLKLQQELNDATNGLGWESGITSNGKLINWKRCAYLECAELIESYPWKHWKNIDAEADFDNIKIEAVDIWHFIMSQALEEYKINSLGDIDKLSSNIKNISNYSNFLDDIQECELDYYKQIEIVENLIAKLFDDSKIDILVKSFFDVAMQSGLNLDSLYNLYVGKNILNKFRQDNGYKDGSYIKIWNGKEDNEVMQGILESVENITPDKLYKELEIEYKKL